MYYIYIYIQLDIGNEIILGRILVHKGAIQELKETII